MAGDSTDSCGDAGESGDGDPRHSTQYVRTIERAEPRRSDRRTDGREARTGGASPSADAGTITLVGVVHDHPASVARVQRVIADRNHDALALELPPLAVPLFERYAEDASWPPETGGEMSAAIQASDADRTAGIDGPTPGFAVQLGRHLLAERPPLPTARTAVERFARASGHALACRAGAVLAALTGRGPELSAPREHAVTADDPPAEQARDERKQVRLARSVAAAFGRDRSVATRDELREAHMADRLASIAESGAVVAVLGVDHVESVAERLDAR
ncbi:hypothetical protein GCM10028857_25920 [Salinarchaeum chitinilyticum]